MRAQTDQNDGKLADMEGEFSFLFFVFLREFQNAAKSGILLLGSSFRGRSWVAERSSVSVSELGCNFVLVTVIFLEYRGGYVKV